MILGFLAVSNLAVGREAPAKAEHVVLVVCDGLRPDSVTERDMPTLYRMSQQGTCFDRHHPAYLSSTEVNGTTLATGMKPINHGVFANKEYRPRIDPSGPIDIEAMKVVRRGDEVTGGRYLPVKTIAELLHAAGKRTIIAGTKPVVLLMDRSPRRAGEMSDSVNLIFEKTLPSELAARLKTTFGKTPFLADPKIAANSEQDLWTTRTLVDGLWRDGLPALTVLWLSEPDFAQHGSGPGSAVARAALRSSDDNLQRVLAALDKMKAADKTDVLVVSDHGFSTIAKAVDFVELLKRAGFRAYREFDRTPTAGDILVVGNGGSVLFYVIGHDESTLDRLTAFLQKSESVGVILSRKTMPGTFTMDNVGIDPAGDCDLVVSLRWFDEPSKTGVVGTVVSEGTKRLPGQGNHGSLSRTDMRNTLIAHGPSFRRGYVDELPTGNVDVTPTILWNLGLRSAISTMDGRVLSEALAEAPTSTIAPETTSLKADRELGDVRWSQFLKISSVGSHRYIDEGNGRSEMIHTPVAHASGSPDVDASGSPGSLLFKNVQSSNADPAICDQNAAAPIGQDGCGVHRRRVCRDVGAGPDRHVPRRDERRLGRH